MSITILAWDRDAKVTQSSTHDAFAQVSWVGFVLVLYALDGRSGNHCDIGDTEQESFGCPCPDMLPKLGFFCSFWNSARRPPAGDQEDQETAGGLLDQEGA
jgi:hypothetical protein